MTNTKKSLAAIGLIGAGYAVYKVVTGKEPPRYSLKWIEGLSAEQWELERMNVQNQYRNPQLDITFREECKRILGLFDKVKCDRDWAGKIPQGPSYHREHGKGLYKKE